MRIVRVIGLALGLGASLSLGAVVDEAAAQANCGGGGGIPQVNCALINQTSDASGGEGGEGGNARGGAGGDGGSGGLSLPVLDATITQVNVALGNLVLP